MRIYNFEKIFLKCLPRSIKDNMPDEIYLKLRYKANTGKRLNLNSPRLFNEKLQWLKLHDRKALYTLMVDKYQVKKYVAEKIGEEYVIPTIGVWDSFDAIDFDKLPNQFVLKCTNDSGGLYICRDKTEFDRNVARKKIERSLKRNYFFSSREWPYKNVKPRVIAEKYMEESGLKELRDYKVFVFNGMPYCIQVDYNRFTDHKRNFYSTNWEYMPFTTCYPTDETHVIKKPKCLDELFELAKKLANNLNNPPFLRTDFYIIDEKIYFGEVTFYHGSGYERFYPEEYDLKLGELMDLGGKNEFKDCDCKER